MKAKRTGKTPPRRRWLGWGLCGLGGLLLVTLVLVLPVGNRLSCDRSIAQRVSCRLSGANLVGIAWRQTRIEPLVGVETNLQSSVAGYRYRTALFTYQAEIPLASFAVDERTAWSAKETIRTFLADENAKNLTLTYRPPAVILITSIVFAATILGLGFLLVWI